MAGHYASAVHNQRRTVVARRCLQPMAPMRSTCGGGRPSLPTSPVMAVDQMDRFDEQLLGRTRRLQGERRQDRHAQRRGSLAWTVAGAMARLLIRRLQPPGIDVSGNAENLP